MLELKAEGLRKEWNGITCFEQVDIELHAGEHIAILGQNGVGKTTLLQALVGKIQVDSGSIYRRIPTSEWGYLEQKVHYEEGITVLDYVRQGSKQLYELYKSIENYQRLLSDRTLASDDMEKLVVKYSETLDKYDALGGYAWEAKIEKYLHQYDLEQSKWSLPIQNVSGGQKTRVQLVRLMVQEPKVILLDEPTNHLDMQSIIWLEEWVQNYAGAVLYVSHDRQFIDQTAHKTYEFTSKGTKLYKGGYSMYREQKDLEIRTQQALYMKQQKEKEELIEMIRTYRQWFHQAHKAAGERNPFMKKKAAKHAKTVKAKERALERLEKNEVQKPSDGPKVHVVFEESTLEAQTLVSIENVTFSYGTTPIFKNLQLYVQKGDRLAVIGKNGSGKSTLLKLICKQIAPQQGRITHNPQLKIGYFAQELDDLNVHETILDTVLKIPGMTQSFARTILACFLFRRDDVFKLIGDLSMGERCRVAFVKLYFSGANLLVLDEPTNYLDIATKEIIEEALAQFPGGLIVVSHDRYLLRKITNKVLSIEQEPSLFHGGYAEYEEQKRSKQHQYSNRNDEEEMLKLELQLTQYITGEFPEDPQLQKEMMNEMQAIRSKIEHIKQKSIDRNGEKRDRSTN